MSKIEWQSSEKMKEGSLVKQLTSLKTSLKRAELAKIVQQKAKSNKFEREIEVYRQDVNREKTTCLVCTFSSWP